MKYLENEIKSGKNPHSKKVEIVIVDDGSKDKTLEVIKGYTRDCNPDKGIVVRGF